MKKNKSLHVRQKVVNRIMCAHRANRPCHPDAVSVKIVGCSIASLTSTTFLMRSITPSYQEARNHNPKTRTGHVPNPNIHDTTPTKPTIGVKILKFHYKR